MIDPGPCAWDLPDPRDAEPGHEVLAVGADLEPSTLLSAYARGLFPMHVSDGASDRDLGWWSPDPRGILPLDGLHVSRSLRRSMRRFSCTVDTAFREVMCACAEGRSDGAWITEEFVDGYTRLHEMGWAHSVEVWRADRLVGGLYGVEIGGLFAGESMFHRETDASKTALVALVDVLRSGGDPGGRILDVQWRTDHLATLGVVEIPRAEYLSRLGTALLLHPAFTGGATGAAPVPR